MAGQGSRFPSAWLSYYYKGRRNLGAKPRTFVTIAALNSANEAIWTDWAFGTPAPGIGGLVKYWTGVAWAEKPVKVWSGTAWVQKPVKAWSGTAWELS